MSTGAADRIVLEAIGIPRFRPPFGWCDPDGKGVHGLNERKSARSVLVGRGYLHERVKR